jgi:hypothetical protein
MWWVFFKGDKFPLVAGWLEIQILIQALPVWIFLICNSSAAFYVLNTIIFLYAELVAASCECGHP